MREMGRPGIVEKVPIKPGLAKKTVLVADKVVAGVLSNTVGRAARFAGKRILGEFPEEAVDGSYHDRLDKEAALFQEEVAPKLSTHDADDEELFRQLYEENALKETAVHA